MSIHIFEIFLLRYISLVSIGCKNQKSHAVKRLDLWILESLGEGGEGWERLKGGDGSDNTGGNMLGFLFNAFRCIYEIIHKHLFVVRIIWSALFFFSGFFCRRIFLFFLS